MSNDKKADFSDVTSTVDSTAAVAPKADFSDVTARVDSTAQIAGGQQYTVQKGDSLSRIAKHLLGDANAWKQIFEANRDVLSDPDKIFPGQTLKIPPRQG
ncbi:LysM peptidoglycan-binding domain-containing protein [Stenotrophomonas acidaminiphila]|uniref:LysM peptidoglycan-binding domain-containing protein n=1 Tax=Stenotrophomonas acidaminiphila TaxID=128780 RepID=UPI001DA27848|nr:LysM peptidoglycan-binding domain-containing protein [Stenotrophomonas acidaminiphila]MPS36185.1 LysM peptidoglycan-binding domain-containing protein [Stenotrophomonas sp.]WPU56290.1 LysM peptidoglycan-binding domain-containing protein [Stenotrophomonas acidaminiphila]